MLRQRVSTAVVMLVVVFGTLFLAPVWVWGLVSLAGLWTGSREWSNLLTREPGNADRLWPLLITLAGSGWLIWRLLNSPEAGTTTVAIPLLVWFVLGAAALAWPLVAIPSLRTGQLRGRSIGFAALVIGGLWAAVLELRLLSPMLLVTAMALVWFADIGAYFCGRRWGRRKLAPAISPGKTWEGALGGAVFAAVMSMAAAWLLPTQLSLVPVSLASGPGGIPVMLLVVLLLVALSVSGDLYESQLKRARGVKDSGTVLPGHGGLLDRIDALVPTMPVIVLLLAWFR